MAFLYFLADVFIDTFGITRPTPAARRNVAFFIFGLTLLVIAVVTIAGLVIHFSLRV